MENNSAPQVPSEGVYIYIKLSMVFVPLTVPNTEKPVNTKLMSSPLVQMSFCPSTRRSTLVGSKDRQMAYVKEWVSQYTNIYEQTELPTKTPP